MGKLILFSFWRLSLIASLFAGTFIAVCKQHLPGLGNCQNGNGSLEKRQWAYWNVFSF